MGWSVSRAGISGLQKTDVQNSATRLTVLAHDDYTRTDGPTAATRDKTTQWHVHLALHILFCPFCILTLRITQPTTLHNI